LSSYHQSSYNHRKHIEKNLGNEEKLFSIRKEFLTSLRLLLDQSDEKKTLWGIQDEIELQAAKFKQNYEAVLGFIKD